MTYDFIIIGTGIVGLATGLELNKRYPDKKILILDKASSLAADQSGHNSGVIHSGIYYPPGSLKAQFAAKGCQKMVEFCEEYQVPYRRCGKVIAAVKEKELPILNNLYERGLQNGLQLKKLGQEEIKEIEPYLTALAGIYVPNTSVVDFIEVCKKYAELLKKRNVEIKLGHKVLNIIEEKEHINVETDQGLFVAQWLIACAGLQSDRLAKLAGCPLTIKIVPFRGEFQKLNSNKNYLVKGLIYPVPDPKLPFLGVHFSRGVNEVIKIGPNALLGLAREGYRRGSFNFKDSIEIINYNGFWKFILKYWQTGLNEWFLSRIKSLYLKQLQAYIPDIRERDIKYYTAGIRAQALDNSGNLVNDFYFVEGRRSLHVCNAPSPAATASLLIAEYIVNRIEKLFK